MSQLSNATLSFLQLFSINMNKTRFVSTSYKVKREMESSSLFFSSELKLYSEFLIQQEKYVCSLTTETIGLFVANSILLLFPKCVPYFFPEALFMSLFNSRWSSGSSLYFHYFCQLLHNFSAADM